MNDSQILKMIDHTILAQNSTSAQVERICAEAAMYGFASVCVPPCYVRTAADALKRLGSAVPVCTVIGFPLGYNDSRAKMAETTLAIEDGATELDMVINVGKLLSGDTGYVLDEIQYIKNMAGKMIVKVIIETCLLDEQAKLTACDLVTRGGADFIKTSTGFSTGGATVEDIQLLRANVGSNVRVKASGGIRTAEQARALVAAGADRLGMSAAVKAFNLE
ncbi:deoxyribose-phosphate aldolase [Clostridia bacterium]|nr:deoxyribose-phosphate aldolase [Clostridia bacterium]